MKIVLGGKWEWSVDGQNFKFLKLNYFLLCGDRPMSFLLLVNRILSIIARDLVRNKSAVELQENPNGILRCQNGILLADGYGYIFTYWTLMIKLVEVHSCKSTLST